MLLFHLFLHRKALCQQFVYTSFFTFALMLCKNIFFLCLPITTSKTFLGSPSCFCVPNVCLQIFGKYVVFFKCLGLRTLLVSHCCVGKCFLFFFINYVIPLGIAISMLYNIWVKFIFSSCCH